MNAPSVQIAMATADPQAVPRWAFPPCAEMACGAPAVGPCTGGCEDVFCSKCGRGPFCSIFRPEVHHTCVPDRPLPEEGDDVDLTILVVKDFCG